MSAVMVWVSQEKKAQAVPHRRGADCLGVVRNKKGKEVKAARAALQVQVLHHVVGQQLAGRARGHQLALEQQRSEEHTSELQSPCNLVCRLLLEKKKTNFNATDVIHGTVLYLFE